MFAPTTGTSNLKTVYNYLTCWSSEEGVQGFESKFPKEELWHAFTKIFCFVQVESRFPWNVTTKCFNFVCNTTVPRSVTIWSANQKMQQIRIIDQIVENKRWTQMTCRKKSEFKRQSLSGLQLWFIGEESELFYSIWLQSIETPSIRIICNIGSHFITFFGWMIQT